MHAFSHTTPFRLMKETNSTFCGIGALSVQCRSIGETLLEPKPSWDMLSEGGEANAGSEK